MLGLISSTSFVLFANRARENMCAYGSPCDNKFDQITLTNPRGFRYENSSIIRAMVKPFNQLIKNHYE